MLFMAYSVLCDCVVYVGETGGILYHRIQNHLSSIRCMRNEIEVAAHFNQGCGAGAGVGAGAAGAGIFCPEPEPEPEP